MIVFYIISCTKKGEVGFDLWVNSEKEFHKLIILKIKQGYTTKFTKKEV
jgi:hypothetical protein